MFIRICWKAIPLSFGSDALNNVYISFLHFFHISILINNRLFEQILLILIKRAIS